MILSIYFMACSVFVGWSATHEKNALWQVVMFLGASVCALCSAYLWQAAMRKEEQQKTHRQE